MSFKTAFAAGIVSGLLLTSSLASAHDKIDVISTSGCGCCIGWVRHMQDAGYKVTNLAMADLHARKMQAGLKQGQTSCHTAFVNGYVIEGHVPATDVGRLLSEKPDAIGLTVPGMPQDAPGMGTGDEHYDVFLVKNDGTAEIFGSYPV
ncbi:MULTISPECIES: DUF411 domain-containing protein [Aurantimonadaceae]|uniref:DUF411 domain-containing protein n=1 Tax=Jiella pelagia TaxID=2986949 RepID=A0ABY7C9L1_9HYPH|nr:MULTISPECIES: DUF411 domain-containing protein [Aurantimonadaceae]ORE96956.1 hypothetical protein ATO4_10664 [Aurantimonas sp. 22II-16-19i]WAP71458.1 DUF411 domain-containing protein [Jiella pelagia]